MAITFSDYLLSILLIPLGMCVFIFLGMYLLTTRTEKGKEFVQERIIGIDTAKASNIRVQETNAGDDSKGKRELTPVEQRAVKRIDYCLWILSASGLSIVSILLFQSCVLKNVRVYPNDECPEYSMDCFILRGNSFHPFSNDASFRCHPHNMTAFPSHMTHATAQCYGWIISKQTAQNILDQLGACSGLLGFFTTLVAVVTYLGKVTATRILSGIFILIGLAAIPLVTVFKVNYSLLSYAVFALSILLGLYGLMLYHVLDKLDKEKVGKQTIVEYPDLERSASRRSELVSIPLSPLKVSSRTRLTSSPRPSRVTPSPETIEGDLGVHH